MLAAVKDGLAASEIEAARIRRPSLTAAARDVVGVAGRDEETSLWSNKETDGYEAVRVAFSGGRSCHGVPRATIVLAKTSIFRAQATSARLCSFPAAMSRR